MKVTQSLDNFSGHVMVEIRLTIAEAKRIRAALSDCGPNDLDNYGGILEVLRRALPQQYGR